MILSFEYPVTPLCEIVNLTLIVDIQTTTQVKPICFYINHNYRSKYNRRRKEKDIIQSLVQ